MVMSVVVVRRSSWRPTTVRRRGDERRNGNTSLLDRCGLSFDLVQRCRYRSSAYLASHPSACPWGENGISDQCWMQNLVATHVIAEVSSSVPRFGIEKRSTAHLRYRSVRDIDRRSVHENVRRDSLRMVLHPAFSRVEEDEPEEVVTTNFRINNTHEQDQTNGNHQSDAYVAIENPTSTTEAKTNPSTRKLSIQEQRVG